MIGIDYSSKDLNNTDRYKLSSIISEDNLLFALTRLSDNKIIKIKEFSGLKSEYYLDTDFLMKLFDSNKLLHDNIIATTVAYLAKDFSLIPTSILNDENQNYNKLLNSIEQYLDDFYIQKSYIKNIDSFCFFPFPKAFGKVIKNNYKNFEIVHANDSLICKAPQVINVNDFILVNFHEYSIQTVVFRDRKFIQSNIYRIKTKEDILYYILLNLKNNALPLNTASVYLSGRVYVESAIYKLLHEHIKNIYFSNNLPRTDFSNIFLGKPKHLFFDIYSLSQCV